MYYEIRVRGKLKEEWSHWFNGAAITLHAGADGVPETCLVGSVADQAALRGLLNRIWNLNLSLISVVCRDSAPAIGQESQGQVP